jgi:hypothetical protein
MKCPLGLRTSIQIPFFVAVWIYFLGSTTWAQGKVSSVRIQGKANERHEFRKTSGKGLPITLLERFRNEFPAAVEVRWEQKKILQTAATRADAEISWVHRVRGWNLGQSFAAEYSSGSATAHAVHTLERPEDLGIEQRSEVLRRWPNQEVQAVLCSRPSRGKPTYKVLLQNIKTKRFDVALLESPDGAASNPCPNPSPSRRKPRLRTDQQRLLYLLETCPTSSPLP